jgi:hypothetical protein
MPLTGDEVEYRIEFQIQRFTPGRDDFEEIGFGSSGAWESTDPAAHMLVSAVQNGIWETEAGQPEPGGRHGRAAHGEGGEVMDQSRSPTELRRLADAVESQECTGVAARWCPVHGTCSCPANVPEMTDERCPLHSPASSHAAAILTEIFAPVVAAGSGG